MSHGQSCSSPEPSLQGKRAASAPRACIFGSGPIPYEQPWQGADLPVHGSHRSSERTLPLTKLTSKGTFLLVECSPSFMRHSRSEASGKCGAVQPPEKLLSGEPAIKPGSSRGRPFEQIRLGLLAIDPLDHPCLSGDGNAGPLLLSIIAHKVRLTFRISASEP